MSRIVYVCASRIPGLAANSFHVMKMMQAFVQEGYDAHLIVPGPGPEGQMSEAALACHYGVKHLPKIHAIVRNASGTNHEYYARAAMAAAHLGGDFVYTRCLGSAPVSAFRNRPTIYEAHAPTQRRSHSAVFRLLLRAPGFRRLNVISQALLEMYRSQFPRLDEADVAVLPDAVDLERFEDLPAPEEARRRLNFESGFTAGYAGHLYAGRGIELILDLALRLPNVRFLLVGGRKREIEEVRSDVARRGLKNVHLTGFVRNDDLALHLAACEVLLMPYQRSVAVEGGGDSSRWMSPMKMFEYMAAGRLVVSSDLPVLREILDERNAALVPPDNVGAWEAAIDRARSDVDWRGALACRARRDVAAHSWRVRARRAVPSTA